MKIDPILQNGSTGAEMRRLQRILVMLNLLDYRGIDGIVGPNTRGALPADPLPRFFSPVTLEIPFAGFLW